MGFPLSEANSDSMDEFKELVYESIQEVCFLAEFSMLLFIETKHFFSDFVNVVMNNVDVYVATLFHQFPIQTT